MAGLIIPSTFTAINRFSGPVRAMENSMRSFVSRSQVGLAHIERGYRRLMTPVTNLQNMMRGLGVYVGLFSLIMLLRSATGVMMDFEQAQINIASVAEKDSIPYLKALSQEARKVAVQYGQSASAISAFQFELIKMGYSAQDALKMTEPITTGAVALRTSPERLQEVVGAVLKSHDMQSSNTKKVVNQIAYISNATAAQFEDIATMLPIINRLSHKMNIPFEQSLAVLGQLRNVQIHTSTGATSFKNILLDLKAQSWDDLKKGIMKVAAAKNATMYAYDKFGKRSVVSAIEIADSLKMIEQLASNAANVSGEYTNTLAAKQLDSGRGRVQLFGAAYREMILSVDEGNGPFASALKHFLDVGAAMLLMGAGSEAARDRLVRMNNTVTDAARKYSNWLMWAGRIVAVFLAMRVAIFAVNTLVLVGRGLWFLYSVALGISAAAGWTNVWALRGNIVALTLLRGITWLVTAAQWAWNFAMSSNPIGAIIVAISLMISWVAICIDSYNEWGAAALMLTGGIGFLVNLIMSIKSHWDAITAAFRDKGFLSGILEIGKAIMDAVLYPLQQIFETINRITGFKWATSAAQAMQSAREKMGIDINDDSAPTKEPVNLNNERQKQTIENIVKDWKGVIDINNNTPYPAAVRSSTGPKFRMGSTFNSGE